MVTTYLRWIVCCTVLGQLACIQAGATRCDNGVVCPKGTVCHNSAGCVLPDQQCDGEGPCSFAGQEGTCLDGICVAGCGDTIVSEPEMCDGANLNELDCTNLPPPYPRFYDTDGLACTDSCVVDVSSCSGGFCGDSIVNGDEQFVELCDFAIENGPGSRPPVGNCASFGFEAGALDCSTSCESDISRCARIGWHLMASPTGATLSAVSVVSADFAFAVGEEGAIIRYDGDSWSQEPQITTSDLTAIWAAGPNDAFAAGMDNTLLHFDGNRWTSMTSPWSSSTEIRAIWGASPSEVFAGSALGIVRYNGASWQPMQTPSGTVRSIWGTSGASVMVAAGFSIWQYDGNADGVWSEMAIEPAISEILTGIWTDSSGAAVATGNNGTLLHLEAGTWRPALNAPTTDHLRSVWGSSATDVFATGENGTLAHFDGEKWHVESSETNRSLTAVGGAGPGNVLTVGTLGAILANQGRGFVEVSPGPVANAILGESVRSIYSVGDGGLISHFDGDRWSPQTTETSEDLFAIWGNDPDTMIAVGERGSILRFDSTSGDWKLEDQALTTDLLEAVWGTGPDDIFVSGEDILGHFDGVSWTRISYPSETNLRGIWGDAANVFAVGLGGRILHYDREVWTDQDSGITTRLNTVWGNGPTDVFAAGSGGIILHYDGASWSRMSTATGAEIKALWGNGPSDVFAAGTLGTLLHYDGEVWSPVQLSDESNVSGLWGTNRQLFVFGGSGSTPPPGGYRHLIRTVPWHCQAIETDCDDRTDNDCDDLVDAADPDC